MEFKSQEIPEDIPFEEYRHYIRYNIKYRYPTIPENDWGEYERKERANIVPREALFYKTRQEVEEQGWNEHTLWHKEIVRKGYDLNIPTNELWELLNRF